MANWFVLQGDSFRIRNMVFPEWSGYPFCHSGEGALRVGENSEHHFNIIFFDFQFFCFFQIFFQCLIILFREFPVFFLIFYHFFYKLLKIFINRMHLNSALYFPSADSVFIKVVLIDFFNT